MYIIIILWIQICTNKNKDFLFQVMAVSYDNSKFLICYYSQLSFRKYSTEINNITLVPESM